MDIQETKISKSIISNNNCKYLYTYVGKKDYTTGPYNVTFHAGDFLAEFNISISDDNIKQTNKTFILTVDPSSLPNYVSVGEPDNATVIVMDNDSKLCIFSQV